MSAKKWVCMACAAIMLFTQTAFAAEKPSSAYEALQAARAATHKAGSLKMTGSENTSSVETSGSKTTQSNRHYYISGYIVNANETHLRFDQQPPAAQSGSISSADVVTTSFLVTTSKMYIKNDNASSEWLGLDLTAMLPKFIGMGILDQFFLLELLNGDRLALYKDYVRYGSDASVGGIECRTLKVDVSRQEFARLTEVLTEDMSGLLGEAAKGMGEKQLALLQTFARGVFKNLDAELHYVFYVEPTNGRIIRVDLNMDMANPYGNRAPGVTSRVKTNGAVTLYHFGGIVNRVKVQ